MAFWHTSLLVGISELVAMPQIASMQFDPGSASHSIHGHSEKVAALRQLILGDVGFAITTDSLDPMMIGHA